ncbi:hypothetical protein [Alkalibacillus haloalkaliphilus]|uniref:Uncharacterized protein n=1 Tax=Alkalibacillus haloalkaliphilus TaxID=94136 RepID=A0A511W259_9BACI|nr:hypothetical protein [Alkalibacillus haloalkaliphilus]GEN44851.1 hypothetical protein AHA02nite_06270 [Alkalibacillus haloalkaliphilus]
MIINIITGILVLGVSLLVLAGWFIFDPSFQTLILVPITAILLWVLAVIGERKIVKFRTGFRILQILLAALALIYLIYAL